MYPDTPENEFPVVQQEVPMPVETPQVKLEPSGLPKDIEDAIITIHEFFRKEDEGTRNLMVGFWKKLENYFSGITKIFWDFSRNDWARIPQLDDTDELDPTFYDKIINIYRAHGESLIAALSIKLPTVNIYPDDADIQEDIETAKAYQKIAGLITSHNKAILLFIKSLFILYNQGVVCAYIRNRKSKEYGTVPIPQYGEDLNVSTNMLTCPACGSYLGESPEAPEEEVECPECGMVPPNVETIQETIPQIVGEIEEPKSRTVIDVFGPLYAQFPFYCRKQSDIPSINLRFEQHVSTLKSIYSKNKELKAKIPTAGKGDEYDRAARTFNNLEYSVTKNLITTNCRWIRPSAYEVLPNEEIIEKMHEMFPSGCYAVILEDNIVAEAREEKLDDCWEISVNPLSNFLHADPMGKPLAPIQEIENEINDLALETFEHSIPETFADPTVLDFKKYKEERAKPGMKFPAKPPAGKSLSDGFYTDKPATLTDEIQSYENVMAQKGQFVSGSFPSIYGGPAQSGSKTASEYSESRAMALQRLNITWTTVKFWWAGVMGKAAVTYAKDMLSDEKDVTKSPQSESGYVNVWIKQAELTGKIGKVEPEIDEELPVSAAQIRGLLMELFTLNSDYINEALFHPQNTPIITKAFGIPNFHIPGQDSRDKQYAEISSILNGEPVSVDLDIDDHQVEIQTCRSWLVSPTGQIVKKLNPPGYYGVVMHLREHLFVYQQLTEQQNETPAGEKPESVTTTTRS